jgi:hypothetical protein
MTKAQSLVTTFFISNEIIEERSCLVFNTMTGATSALFRGRVLSTSQLSKVIEFRFHSCFSNSSPCAFFLSNWSFTQAAIAMRCESGISFRVSTFDSALCDTGFSSTAKLPISLPISVCVFSHAVEHTHMLLWSRSRRLYLQLTKELAIVVKSGRRREFDIFGSHDRSRCSQEMNALTLVRSSTNKCSAHAILGIGGVKASVSWTGRVREVWC